MMVTACNKVGKPVIVATQYVLKGFFSTTPYDALDLTPFFV